VRIGFENIRLFYVKRDLVQYIRHYNIYFPSVIVMSLKFFEKPNHVADNY